MKPRVRQLLVATSAYLAAISAGASIGYPTVLLQQFKDNDSFFQVDADTSSWIGSIQGIAGIPSIFMPAIMQIKGRKVAYFISCLVLALGWITIFFAKNVVTIIIGQFFLGLGSNSFTLVGFSTLSEMIEPRLRSFSMIFIGIFLSVGVSVVHALGRSFCWAYVDVMMFIPILLSGVMSLFWVESPAWLAYKCEFEKCEKSFNLLRGTGEKANKELRELIKVKKRAEGTFKSYSFIEIIKRLCKTLFRRDCYWPCLHTIVILIQMYWGGSIVIYIYSQEMLEGTTTNQTAIFICLVYIDFIVIVGAIASCLLLKYFDNKTILLASGAGVVICLTLTFVITYLQFLGYLPKDSILGSCFLLGFVTSSNIGISTLSFSLPTELMPVKHKSFGGALYIICCSVLHSSVLKSFPYMQDYFGLLGSLILFDVVTLFCTFYIWKYVPITRHKTLQEIEMSYIKNVDISIYDTIESEAPTESADLLYQATVYKFS